MVNNPWTRFDDVTEIFVAAPFVFLNQIVRGGKSVNREAAQGVAFSVVEPARVFDRDFEAVDHELAISFRNDQLHFGVGLDQGKERVAVEMIGVIMAGGDHVDEVEPFGSDDALGHSDVGFVCVCVFFGKRIGEIWIKQKMMPLPLNKKATLAEPP